MKCAVCGHKSQPPRSDAKTCSPIFRAGHVSGRLNFCFGPFAEVRLRVLDDGS
jgi:hypothetical protein